MDENLLNGAAGFFNRTALLIFLVMLRIARFVSGNESEYEEVGKWQFLR